jgi:2-oxoglutarate ferredoxin oxidoreductase subunit alpha
MVEERMSDVSILIGGKAGDGINRAGLIIARLLAATGYRIYLYYDYPSLIRGGHNFAIVRASPEKVRTHRTGVDFLLALDQNTLRVHEPRCGKGTAVLYNADTVKGDVRGTGVPIDSITREEGGIPIMANSCLIGAFCKSAGIGWETVDGVIRMEIPHGTDLNLTIARRGYDAVATHRRIEPIKRPPLPFFTGNEAIALGLLRGGLDAYVAYPMTPSSSILHYLAAVADDFALKVVHPENEIAVMLMAQGFAYAGAKTAVGTSGGGFCLMTEGLSLAGMSEVPVTLVVSQRAGPSTGVPTYTAQSDLGFVLHAGQGEFPRFVIAPGDAEQAYAWSAMALQLAWKYQVPAFILADKSLSESVYCFDRDAAGLVEPEAFPQWDGHGIYRRYADSLSGVSPLATVPVKDAAIKVNSYAHDEDGISTEDASVIAWLNEKHLKKEAFMLGEIEAVPSVVTSGNPDAADALLCWGSNAGVCAEVAAMLDIRAVQPVVLSPLPVEQLIEAFRGVERIIAVEDNQTAQLARIVESHGIAVTGRILRYDGRPNALEDLYRRVTEVIV